MRLFGRSQRNCLIIPDKPQTKAYYKLSHKCHPGKCLTDFAAPLDRRGRVLLGHWQTRVKLKDILPFAKQFVSGGLQMSGQNFSLSRPCLH
jgi:hypothetical protein